MANFEISNLTVSRDKISVGSSLIVSFTLKNTAKIDGKNATIYSVGCRLSAQHREGMYLQLSERYSSKTDIAYGKNIGQSIAIRVDGSEWLTSYFENNPDKRALPVVLECRVDYHCNYTSYAVDEKYLEIPVTHLKDFCAPAINEFTMERSIDGVENDEGVEALTSLKVFLNPNADNTFMKLHLHYAKNAEATENSTCIDLTDKIPALLNGVSGSTELISDDFSNGSNWDFLLVFGDEYEKVIAKQSFARAFANMHLSGETTGGACFGGFSSSTLGMPKLESHYEGFFYRGIHGVSNYSEGEVATGGHWIDGKPIYRAALAGSVTESGRIQLPQITPCTEIETIINISGTAVVPGGNPGERNFMSLPHVNYSGLNYCVGVRAYQNGKGELYIGSQYSKGVDYVIIIEYTKAEDDPIEPIQTHVAFTDNEGKQLIDDNDSSFMTEVY